MRKLLEILALSLPLLLALGHVATATPAGRWVAEVPPKPYCSPSRLTLDLRGGTVVGSVVNPEGVSPVTGEVDPDGYGTIRIGQVAGVIRFRDDRFVADYPNLRCGLRHAVGVRVG
jgi:hypothetical protein